MKSTKVLAALLLGLTLGAGVLGGGYSVAKAMYQSRMGDRFVTVKGLAMQNVRADLAVWQIDFREVGGDLVEVNQRIEKDRKIIQDFLVGKGFSVDEIEVRPSKVSDLLANPYNSQAIDQSVLQHRYIITAALRIRSDKVDTVQKVSQVTNELLNQGVSLSYDTMDFSPNPSYIFTQLDKIRPKMLAEATESARSVAAQFAKDAKTTLGPIRRANQGVFQILSRDAGDVGEIQSELSSIDKKVRLVSTIDYLLMKQ